MIRKEKKVIITFDYELFLGKDSGELFTSLIKPTDKILEKLKENNAKALFFIDTPFFIFLKRNNAECYDIVKKQLLNILKQGSYLGLHIHPQWVNAEELSDKRWTFTTFKHYRFHSLDKAEQENMFCDCYNELRNILKEAMLEGKIDQKNIYHFRAGGWSLQPFSVFNTLFDRYNLEYDFSVKPYAKIEKLPYHYYNYESVTTSNDSYKFIDDPCIVDNTGKYKEYPLSAVKVNKYAYWKIKKYIDRKYLNKNKIFGDGVGLSKSLDLNDNEKIDKKRKKIFERIMNKFHKKILYLVFENYNTVIFRIILRLVFCNKKIGVVVGHPKTFSELSLNNLIYTIQKYKTYIP